MTKTKKPLIGVTAPTKKVAMNFSANQTGTWIADAFLSLIRRSGGVPVVLPVVSDPTDAEPIVAALDGLLLTSGEDVSPDLYGQELQVKYLPQVTGMGKPYERSPLLQPDRARDLSELALYRAARARKLPVLGICRGAQLMNVAEGGTLHQEQPETHVDHEVGPDGWIHYHDIRLLPGSRAHEILGLDSIMIPSVHHQSVDRVAPTLRACAHSDDGIVEMIELVARDEFVIGVQGHIEKTARNLPAHEKLVAAFVREASKLA